jgi:hypothetical protein
VPSGVSYVRITAAVNLSSVVAGSDTFIWVTKNGDNVSTTRHVYLPVVGEDTSSTTMVLNLASGPLSVVATDYFELRLLCPDTSITVEDFSWFAIEKLG